MMENKDILVDVQGLTHQFPMGKKKSIKAVHHVSFQIRRDEIFSLVGESGSGKSTVARCLMNIYEPTEGTIRYDGINLCDKKEREQHKTRLQRERQIIFQDSASALNQRMKTKDIVAEPLRIQHIFSEKEELDQYVRQQLEMVGLEENYLNRRPSELSGGQRQRIAIARAFGMKPRLLVADEPIASLDVSIQAQVIKLFQHLQEEHDCAILFIAHDLSMVRYLSDRVGVMCKGHLVEMGETEKIFQNPLHSYTKSLLSAIPVPDPALEKKRSSVTYDAASIWNTGIMVEAEEGHWVMQEEADHENLI
ncbi:MAG: ATP-binding cassette domain-containing protein [Lachnospiraceae bacterium]|nr:ATP-binding cassette domain-containing protein [Lachnospiraceae bacterium]